MKESGEYLNDVELIKAIYKGDKEKAKKVIDNGANPKISGFLSIERGGYNLFIEINNENIELSNCLLNNNIAYSKCFLYNNIYNKSPTVKKWRSNITTFLFPFVITIYRFSLKILKVLTKNELIRTLSKEETSGAIIDCSNTKEEDKEEREIKMVRKS